MIRSLLSLITVQLKEFRRDPEVLFWGMLFPIALAWLLGMAFTQQGVLSRPVGVLAPADQQAQLLTQWRLQDFAARFPQAKEENKQAGRHTRFHFIFYEDNREALRALKRGVISLYLEPSKDSARPLYHFDPQNSEAQLSYLLLDRINRGQAGEPEPVAPLTTVGSRYIDFLIPGLIALGIMNSCIWGTGWSLIERRMQKLLKRMVATPMPRAAFFFSYFFTRSLMTLIEVAMLFFFSYLSFGVRMQGSLGGFLLVFVRANFAFFGLAILLASRAASSQVGNGLLNAVTVPMTILSGIFFSYHNFPQWAVSVIQLLPLTLVADSLRMVFIEGAAMGQVWIQSLVLVALGAGFFLAGSRMFKWY